MPFRVAVDAVNKPFLKDVWRAIGVGLSEPLEIVPVEVWNPLEESNLDAFLNASDVDALVDMWYVSSSRMQRFQLSVPLPTGRTVFVTVESLHVHTPSAELFTTVAELSVYSTELWLILLSVFSMFLLLSLLITARRRSNQSHHLTGWTWFGHFWLQNTASSQRRSNAMKAVLVSTALFTIHSLTLYQNSLLAELVREPSFVSPVASLTDIIEFVRSRQGVLNLRSHNFFYARKVMESDEPVYATLRGVLKENPALFLLPETAEDMIKFDEIMNGGVRVIEIVDEYDGP